MTEQSPDYLPQDAKPEALRLANVALPRYKIGFGSDEWGWSDSTPSGIPSPDGAWVRFEDAQVLQTGYASARLEIESLKARAQELVAQLDAVGAGGVEPLRRAKCLHQIAEPKQKPVAFGSAEEFSSSDDPHCKNGGKACIDCLMRGECLHQTVEPVPEAAQEPMFWVRLTDSGGYEGPLHRSSIEDAHKKSGAWTPLYTEPQPPAVAQELPYKDSTPKLSVGNSSFESWFSGYSPMHKGDKQRARDAYAAGMGDPLVTTAAPVVAALHDAEAALELACARLREKGGIYPDALAITSEHKAWQSVRAAIALMQANPVEIQQIAAQASLGQPVAWRYIPGAWKSAVLTDDPEQAKLAAEAGVPVTPLYARPAPKPLWLPSDDTEGGAV